VFGQSSGAYVFASYLIRIRIRTDLALPEFVSLVLNSPIGREQINAVSRQIIGQANINSQELRELRIPLPSLTEQAEIVRRFDDARAGIEKQLELASHREEELTRVIETAVVTGRGLD